MHNNQIQQILAKCGKSKVISGKRFIPIDLSADNTELQKVDVSNSDSLGQYVNRFLPEKGDVGFGGYLEKRNIYKRSEYFGQQEDSSEDRDIHIGVDFWAPADTPVLALYDGSVHSIANNTNYGDYGPTIIIQHNVDGFKFHSLYGHLSLSMLKSFQVGETVKKGQEIGTLGTPKVNGDYPPHLHFQMIVDMESHQGDYPGVCAASNLEFYQSNCPNPLSFILID